MAGGYVSGETMLRPVRMGLAIAPGSATGLRRAIELALCLPKISSAQVGVAIRFGKGRMSWLLS